MIHPRCIPSRHRRVPAERDDRFGIALRGAAQPPQARLQTASGGRAGIDAFLDAQKSGKPFPVVITDLGMPHMDGRAVAAAIHAAAPATAIIMLTGWGQQPPKLAELRQWLAEFAGTPGDVS
jgi:CheY-like chemotaxis protein